MNNGEDIIGDENRLEAVAEDFINHYNKKIELLNNVIPNIQNPLKKDEKIKELNELVTLFKYKHMNKCSYVVKRRRSCIYTRI